MKIRPINDHVVLSRTKADEMSKGGLVIPTTVQEKTTEGIVIAVGTGILLASGETRPLGVVVGDHVVFSKHRGQEIKINGEEYIDLREDDIVCILDN